MNELLQEDLLPPSPPPLVLSTSIQLCHPLPCLSGGYCVSVPVLRIHECGEGVKPQTPVLLEINKQSIHITNQQKLYSMLEVQSS